MKLARDQVADLINSCEFTEREIHVATNGQCMWFAVALHNILTKQGLKVGFAVAVADFSSWCHVLVRKGNGLYDIHGKVLAKFIHHEFQSRKLLRIERDQLFDAYSCRDRRASTIIKKWQRRLDAGTA